MAGRLRKLIAGKCVAMPGAFNAATGRLIEQVGFEAVYVSGAGLSNGAAGVPDIGLLSRGEVVTLAGYVAGAVGIPVVVDADTGFGDCGETVEKFVRPVSRGCRSRTRFRRNDAGIWRGRGSSPRGRWWGESSRRWKGGGGGIL